jgi:hypothetical protein
MLAKFLQNLAEAVVILSLLTLIAGILYLVLAVLKKRGAGLVKALAIITGVLSASGGIWLKAIGAEVTTRDEARETVKTFYDHIERKEFLQAFDLLHHGHKEEMKREGRTEDDFAKSYASTRDYRGIQIDLDQVESASPRIYWVAFDVEDSFPANTLRGDSWQSSRKMMDSGIIHEEALLKIVVSDLRRCYQVPNDVRPQIREYIRNAPLHYILEPSFITDVGDGLRLKRREVNGVGSWSHHIEHVKVQKDDGWKIRSGLYPPTFVGTYRPGAEPPRGKSSP